MLLKSTTRRLAFSAVLTALSVALLYLAAVIPSGRIGVTAIAALLPAAAVLSCGIGWSLGVYAATGILALLLLPTKGPAVAYLLVLGHYPVMKSLIERVKNVPLEWILKLALFYALLCAFYFGFKALFLDLVSFQEQLVPVLFVGCGVVFVLYDIAFTRLISLYVRRFSRYIK